MSESWFKTLARFWGLKKTEASLPAGSPTGILAVLTLAWLTLWAIIDWQERQPDPMFTFDGLPVLAWYVLAVIILAAVLRKWSHPAPSFGAVLVLAAGLVPLPVLLLTVVADAVSGPWMSAIFILSGIYALVYLARGLHAMTRHPQRLAALLGVLFIVTFVGASEITHAIPDIWNPRESETNVSEADLASGEAALFKQAERIDAALEPVRRDTATTPDAFFLGFAGVGDQKVFAQEIGLASRVIGERYSTGYRRVSLINDERDLDSAPIASLMGLRYALQGMASRMQLDRDILFLAISSHGSADPAIAVSNSQFPLIDLRPEYLADALSDSGIKWRVIVISACYAGGFIEPLRDAQTIIITAAAPDRTSFGCSNDSDLTYFGEAFYRDALPEATSLRAAFDTAKAAIAAREKIEGEEPSNPQAFFGADLEKHLAALERRAAGGRL